MTDGLLDPIPLWALFVILLAAALASMSVGIRLGRKRQLPKEAPLGTIVGATLGLLAFMLAFTFGLATNRYDARRLVLLDEVEAINGAYLRAGLISRPQGAEIRRLLREYVDLRLEVARHPEIVDTALPRYEQLLGQMWAEGSSLLVAGNMTRTESGLLDALNKITSLNIRRTQLTLGYRVPDVVWGALVGAFIIAMAMVGFIFGLSRASVWAMNLALALTFSVVLTLISDLDRPGQGLLRVSQKPMMELQRALRASPALPQTEPASAPSQ